MYKQILQGFRRKAVPFSLWVGLFLLMISFYEAIWQTPYSLPPGSPWQTQAQYPYI